jgi:hypothetical protein
MSGSSIFRIISSNLKIMHCLVGGDSMGKGNLHWTKLPLNLFVVVMQAPLR